MGEGLLLPVWQDREIPTTYLVDRHEAGQDYSELPETDEGRNADYLEWVNSYKQPPHADMRSVRHRTLGRLGARDISLENIHTLVADITGNVPYPLERV